MTLISLFAIATNGQVNFRLGYIITNNQDTIHGQVDYRGDKRMSEVCNFKTEETGKKTYPPGEIYGYRFNDGRFFVTGEVDGKPKFLEVLVAGKWRSIIA